MTRRAESVMRALEPLLELPAGSQLLVDGNRVLRVSDELSSRFAPGDRLLIVPGVDEPLLVPASELELIRRDVAAAQAAFHQLGSACDGQLTDFYDRFADALESPRPWAAIDEANQGDVANARRRGRSTTRLVADDRLRDGMIADDAEEHASFYATVEAPFVGDGYTRWVDGQFALHRPELGLSNWRNGRLLARGSILSGDGVFTIRTRYRSERSST